jgi:hypothetical protein
VTHSKTHATRPLSANKLGCIESLDVRIPQSSMNANTTLEKIERLVEKLVKAKLKKAALTADRQAAITKKKSRKTARKTELPAEFSGVPQSRHDLLTQRALDAQFGNEITEIKEIEQAIEAAWEALAMKSALKSVFTIRRNSTTSPRLSRRSTTPLGCGGVRTQMALRKFVWSILIEA